jgi:nucleoside-diphosphate kinase
MFNYVPLYGDWLGPVVAMVWEGKNAVVTGRKMLGATNPADSAPGTIRGDFALETGKSCSLERISHRLHSRRIFLTYMYWKHPTEPDYYIFCTSKHAGRNICHGSDSVESAEREIGLWFKEGINEWTAHGAPWIYE